MQDDDVAMSCLEPYTSGCTYIVGTHEVAIERKVSKTGNSLVISLPRETLLNLGLQEGSEVQVTVDEESGRIIIEPLRASLATIEPAFARQLDDFIDRYRPALEALAR